MPSPQRGESGIRALNPGDEADPGRFPGRLPHQDVYGTVRRAHRSPTPARRGGLDDQPAPSHLPPGRLQRSRDHPFKAMCVPPRRRSMRSKELAIQPIRRQRDELERRPIEPRRRGQLARSRWGRPVVVQRIAHQRDAGGRRAAGVAARPRSENGQPPARTAHGSGTASIGTTSARARQGTQPWCSTLS